MRHAISATRPLAISLAATLLGALSLTAQKPAQSPATRTLVLVELFTSEGCSDCPPADALLKHLDTEQPIPGVEVIGIEEHVDYWNHDGWFDPFSSASWTFRQQDYVAKLKAGTEYTPQMVVDGEGQFVGSFAAQAERAIETAAREPQTQVAISAGAPQGKDAEDFSVSVGKLTGPTPGSAEEVWLAVTEDGLHSSVGAGENAGRELYHAAVLRSLNKIGVADASASSTSFTAEPRVKLNSHWKRENLHVVVFVQDKQSKKILGSAWIKAAPQS